MTSKRPISAKRKAAQKEAARKRLQTWQPGQSGNPKGRPALGESYREIFSKVGNLTIDEVKEFYPAYGNRFENVPGDVKLKELVSLSVLVALACEPSPGMLATLLDRTDGPLDHTININKLSDDELVSTVKPILERLGIRLEPPVGDGLEGRADSGICDKAVDTTFVTDSTSG